MGSTEVVVVDLGDAGQSEREALAQGEMADTARAAGLDTCAEGVTQTDP